MNTIFSMNLMKVINVYITPMYKIIFVIFIICNTLILVADNYGVSTYAIFLFSLTIWWAQHWGDATACPYLCFEDCINGSMTFLETAVRTIAATIGGVAVFGYVYLYYNIYSIYIYIYDIIYE